MKNVLVTGANGMLGKDLVPLLKEEGFTVLATDVHNLNITDEKTVSEFFNNNEFDIVIHAAAYTNVDGAESDKETAILINKTGTSYLAKYSAQKNIPIVYISTDYVFDGTKTLPYLPEDLPNPLNVYGLSKYLGEEEIKLNPKHYITRTSWLYGHNGKNFIETMINLAGQKSEINVVNDQFGCPTWTVDLSKAIIDLIKNEKQYGIYHFCGSGETNWFGFAKAIMKIMGYKITINPVSTEQFPRPAERPRFSVMENNNALPYWEESVEEYIKLRGK